MDGYDFVIAGGGLAGLSLAHQLNQSPLGDKSILILDQARKRSNDRTWGFWSDSPTPYDGIINRSWDKLRCVFPGFERNFDLGDYRYNIIRGVDFYSFVTDQLTARDHVAFRQSRVERITSEDDRAIVTLDDGTVSGKWVFDSSLGADAFTEHKMQRPHLYLHFVGWEIFADKDVFDPDVATLMDFRAPQEGETRFFYVLPFTERRALVEYTIFSRVPLTPEKYARGLRSYIRENLGVGGYEIHRQENGCIPVAARDFTRKIGERVMTIGVKGGRLKSTTGYAFTRIQKDSAAIVNSLIMHDHPFDVPASPFRYRFCDSILLDIMEKQGKEVMPIFKALFKGSSLPRIFRFLDESSSYWEHLGIIQTLPSRPFLEALLLPGALSSSASAGERRMKTAA